MGVVIHREAVVGLDGKIEISAPELQPGQRVSISIEPEHAGQQVEQQDQPTEQQHEQPQRRRAIDILNEAPGHLVFKTAEDVDEYLREERDSWER
ncbi:MAG: hypothetical protein ABI068_08860 [Ktedonobacterales bacterium]